jgi:hypothetical protein
MKTLILIIITLLLATPCFAGSGSVAITLSGTAGASGATYTCADCTSGGTCDVLCEDFEGSSACNTGESKCRLTTWSVSETGGTMVAGTGNTSGQSCSEKGTNSVAMTVVTPGSNFGMVYDSGVDKSDVYLSFMIRFSSWDGITNGQSYPIFGTYDSSYNGTVGLIMYLNGTNYNLGLVGTTIAYETTSLALNTWYHVQIRSLKNGTSSLKVNGGSSTTVTALDFNNRTYIFGEGASTYPYAYEWDTLKVDDDTETSSCH